MEATVEVVWPPYCVNKVKMGGERWETSFIDSNLNMADNDDDNDFGNEVIN